ncbi:MAG: alpha/beta hydrolase [Novosphingobium sp.]|nr:alpha/beta hydrolase [Novosphingobium sp.]
MSLNGGAAFDRRAIPGDAIESTWNAPDGYAIRRIDWLIPRGACRGSILFLPGRGDCYEKYLETLDYWHRRGWRVTAADWRGQAGSGRLGDDEITGHIDDFSTWVDDLAALWAQWKASTPGPHVLAAHSMGGHIALRTLAEGRVDPDAVVLSSPMLGLRPSIVPTRVLHWIARFMEKLGDPKRAAWKWDEKPGVPPEGRKDLLTHDRERYRDELWWRSKRPEISMGPPSWGWMERALASILAIDRSGLLEAVETPVLMLATKADRLVDFAAIERAAHRMVRAQLVRYGGEASHEILRECDAVRDHALEKIDDFLDRTAPLVD